MSEPAHAELEHARHLLHRLRRVGHVVERRLAQHAIEGPVRERQRLADAAHLRHPRAQGRALLGRARQHARRRLDREHGEPAETQLARVAALGRAHLEHRTARALGRGLDGDQGLAVEDERVVQAARPDVAHVVGIPVVLEGDLLVGHAGVR